MISKSKLPTYIIAGFIMFVADNVGNICYLDGRGDLSWHGDQCVPNVGKKMPGKGMKRLPKKSWSNVALVLSTSI